MQCWQCGRTVRPGAKLCIYCGAKLADDEEPAPRASESRNGRRSAERGEYRSSSSRGGEDDRGDAPSSDESEEYAAYNPSDARAERRAPSRPRNDGDYREGSRNNPRSRDSRLRDPMDDPRAPFQRGRGATPSSGRERREPPTDSDGYRRGSREHGMEEHPRRSSHSMRDDEWGGGVEQRPPHGSRRDGRDEYAGHERDRAVSSSSSRRRSDMEYDGGYDARDRRGDGYDDRYDRGASRDQRPSRGPQMERERDHGSYRGDARGVGYPQPPLDDSWSMPAIGGGPIGEWGLAPSEELPTPMGARAGRDARSRGGAAGKGRSSDNGKAKGGAGKRIFSIVSLLVSVIGLISTGILVAPKLLGHFGLSQGSTGDNQPPFVAYTPGPTPTPPPNYTEYVSKHLQFVIDYPKTWSAGESSADAGKTDWMDTFAQPSPQAAVEFERSTGFDSISNDEMIHDEVLASQNDGSVFTETTTTPAHALIGGEQWLRRDFDVTPKSGAKVHVGVLSCHHMGHGYVIVLISLQQNFAHDDQTTFQSILSTFRFLS